MNKNDNGKKKFKIPHRLVFILSLLGVAVLMGLYIWFVASWMNNPGYMQDDEEYGFYGLMQDGEEQTSAAAATTIKED